MDRFRLFYKSMLLMVACFYFSLNAFTQSGELRFLDRINPERPTSDLWRGITNSVYPIAIATPLSLLTAGYIQKDEKLKREGWYAVGAVVTNVVVTQGLKKTFKRSRPYNANVGLINYYHFEKDSSFPSGHTSNAFAIATTLSLTNKKWYVIVPAYLWATGVGYSRLYLGQHYPSDVLAGAAIGVGSAFLGRWLTKKLFKK